MTVRKVTNALKDAKSVAIAYNGLAHRLDLSDPVMMEAFGEYLVCAIRGDDSNGYELELAMRPIKATE